VHESHPAVLGGDRSESASAGLWDECTTPMRSRPATTTRACPTGVSPASGSANQPSQPRELGTIQPGGRQKSDDRTLTAAATCAIEGRWHGDRRRPFPTLSHDGRQARNHVDSDDSPAIVPDTPTPWDLDDALHVLQFHVERLERRLAILERVHGQHLDAYRRHVIETHAGWDPGRAPSNRRRPQTADVSSGAPGSTPRPADAVARNAYNSAQQSTRRRLRTRTQQRVIATAQRSLLEGE